MALQSTIAFIPKKPVNTRRAQTLAGRHIDRSIADKTQKMIVWLNNLNALIPSSEANEAWQVIFAEQNRS